MRTLGNNLKGKKKFLLKTSGYKSITEAKRAYDFTGTDEAMFHLLRDEYNEIEMELRDKEKTLWREKRNEAKKEKRQFFSSFNVEDKATNNKENKRLRYNLINSFVPDEPAIRRGVPTIEEFKRFQEFNIEKKYVYPDPVPIEYESLRILNNTIPQIITSLKETKGMKVSYTVGMIFSKKLKTDEDGNEESMSEFREIPYDTKPVIILNQTQIKPFIDRTKTFLEGKIPEMENGESGLKFEYVKYLTLKVNKYNPLKVGKYLPLPEDIENKKCCINIQNDDDKCLMYCVLYHIFKNVITDNPKGLVNINLI
jgi:hypothetical protein